MVKIYLNETDKNGSKKFVDVNIWSLVKANVLSGLILSAIAYGAMFIVWIIILLIVVVVGLAVM